VLRKYWIGFGLPSPMDARPNKPHPRSGLSV
jgi:hypothetical protein